jgi:DNA-binding transcriptional MerR regulator
MQQPSQLNEHETNELSVSRVARLLECSEGLVRVLANRGTLPCRRVLGQRVFDREQVEVLRRQRQVRGAGRGIIT